MRVKSTKSLPENGEFPFLFGGTFIEGECGHMKSPYRTPISLPFRRDFHWGNTSNTAFFFQCLDFPSFSEGLSLRESYPQGITARNSKFPFLFGGTFIEGIFREIYRRVQVQISLPFRRDFH